MINMYYLQARVYNNQYIATTYANNQTLFSLQDLIIWKHTLGHMF